MDKSSIICGTAVFVCLVAMAAMLFALLIRQGVPRTAALEIVEVSTGIFIAALFVTYRVANRLVPDGGESLLIYIPPVVPVGIYVFWLLRRRNKPRNDGG